MRLPMTVPVAVIFVSDWAAHAMPKSVNTAAPSSRNKDVVWFDVTMHDTFFVSKIQCCRDLFRYAENLVDVQFLFYLVIQCFAGKNSMAM